MTTTLGTDAALPVGFVEAYGREQAWRLALVMGYATENQLPPDIHPVYGREVSEAVRAELITEVKRQWITRQARAKLDEIERSRDITEPFDSGLLGELLERPTPPLARIEQLLPWEASTLVSAKRKAGKTTLMLNLTRSLLTGEDFLGRFGVRKLDGQVALLNYEVSGNQIARWADEHSIDHRRLFVVNLRGRRNPLSHPDDRATLAALLQSHDVETLIVDPFGRAYTGKSQNDSSEVGGWLTDLDRFARIEVGTLDLILTAHAGWDGERTRGSSALEDWPDSIVTLTTGTEDDASRYIRALGRDVDFDEEQLTFEPSTRALTIAGVGSRRAVKASARLVELTGAIVHIVMTAPGLNGTEIGDRLRQDGHSFQKGDERKALQGALDHGHIRYEKGARGAKNYFPTDDLPRPAPDAPHGVAATYPDPSLYGG